MVKPVVKPVWVRSKCYQEIENPTLHKFFFCWNSTVFTTVENFWAERNFEIRSLDAEESYKEIRQQILLLNPTAEEKIIRKFIKG